MSMLDNINAFSIVNQQGSELKEVKLPALSKEEQAKQIATLKGEDMPEVELTIMTKEQVLKALSEQQPIIVKGYDGLFLIVEVNLMLKTVGLVRIAGGNGIPDMSVGFEDIEVAD
nr:hypothetical protein [Limosilactobacillus mucosae]